MFGLTTLVVYRERYSFEILIYANTFAVLKKNYRKKSKKYGFVLFYAFRYLSRATPVVIGKLPLIR